MTLISKRADGAVFRTDDELVAAFLPGSPTRQTTAMAEAALWLQHRLARAERARVLDVGCGTGESARDFRQAFGDRVLWFGTDIPDSPEAACAAGPRRGIVLYDGTALPFGDGSFDLIYSRQVFEHVRAPRDVLAEVRRTLSPGGAFVGSTSHLEPFHSRSLWNFTPFGFALLLQEAGFSSIRLAVGVDGPTLITRRLLGHLRAASLLNRFLSRESPLNAAISLAGRLLRFPDSRVLSLKLRYCGHFVFAVTKES